MKIGSTPEMLVGCDMRKRKGGHGQRAKGNPVLPQVLDGYSVRACGLGIGGPGPAGPSVEKDNAVAHRLHHPVGGSWFESDTYEAFPNRCALSPEVGGLTMK